MRPSSHCSEKKNNPAAHDTPSENSPSPEEKTATSAEEKSSPSHISTPVADDDPEDDEEFPSILQPVACDLIDGLDAEIDAVIDQGRTRTIRFSSGKLLRERGGISTYRLQLTRTAPRLEPGRLSFNTGGRYLSAELLDARDREMTVAVQRFLGKKIGGGSVEIDSTAVLEATRDRIEAALSGETILYTDAITRLFLPSFPSSSQSQTLPCEEFSKDKITGEKETKEEGKNTSDQGLTHPHLGDYHLDDYQWKAITAAQADELVFVWGPPGTGKTRTLGALSALLVNAGKRVLVTAHAHVAVDMAILAALAAGARPVHRLGPPQLAEVPDHVVIDTFDTDQQALLFGDETDGSLLAATLAKIAMSHELAAHPFDYILIDEASMAPLPQVFITAGMGERTVIFGDARQLPPVVTTRDENARKLLARDIFSVSGITEATGTDPRVHLLRQQYRAHPAIAAVTNQLSYKGQLLSAPSTETRPPGFAAYDPVPDQPVVVVDTSAFRPVMLKPATSRCNPLSAVIAADIATAAAQETKQRRNSGERQIGIATPYAEQSRLIRLLLEESGMDDRVDVATVHRFQGGEREMMIVDLCDSRPLRVPPFLQDEDGRRLLNVAISRAREKLVLVADPSWLCSGPPAEVIQLAAAYGQVVKADMPDTLDSGNSPKTPPRTWLSISEFLEDVTVKISTASDIILITAPHFRAESLVKTLAQAVDRVDRCALVTDPRTSPEILQYLEEANVEIEVRPRVLERLVIVDDIVYTGNTATPAARAGKALLRLESPGLAQRLSAVLHTSYAPRANI